MDLPAATELQNNYRWVPTMALEPGMVIARPILGGSSINSVIRLAVGTEITASTIAQLVNKGIECVAVITQTAETEDQEALVRQYQARLHEIFGTTPDDNCRPLLEALLAYGPTRC